MQVVNRIALEIGETFATAMAVVREREKGTLETLLVSPLSRWGLMLGKLIPYLCIGMTMATILFLIMRFLFGVPINGSVIAMMFTTLVYVFALLSLGLLVATKAENQMQALQMSMVFMLPSVFFSGFVFPRETMPWIFKALGALLPATYFISLARAIILRGAHFFDYWPHLIAVLGRFHPGVNLGDFSFRINQERVSRCHRGALILHGRSVLRRNFAARIGQQLECEPFF